MKFLVDMPLSPELAAWLAEQGHDAVHAADLGLHSAPDVAIVTRALQDGRSIITADLDYPRLLATAGSLNPSLILFRDGNWNDAEITGRLGDVLRSLSPDDIAQSIIVVDRHRIRRRKLTIVP